MAIKRLASSTKKRNRLHLETLEERRLLSVTPELVADINITAPDAGSYPGLLGTTNDRLYFRAQDGVHQYAIWSTDGTESGTSLAFVADESTFIPFTDESQFATGIDNFYFLARRENNVHEVWVTRGAASGAARLATFNQPFYRMTAIEDDLYFSAPQSFSSLEPWVSDGTETGTRMIKDIAGGSFGGSTPRYFTKLNGDVFFNATSQAANGLFSSDLWKTDGTDEGTQFVASNEQSKDLDPRYLVVSGGRLFFNGGDVASGRELWVSDGSNAGTHRVADLVAGAAGADPRSLTAANGLVFFTALVGEGGVRSLWQSNGTAEGTSKVADSGQIVAATDRLMYFTAPGNKLWRTDGTPEGTFEIRAFGSLQSSLPFTPLAGGVVHETVDNSRRDVSFREIWWTNGNTGETEQLYSRIVPKGLDAAFNVLGNTIFFSHRDAEHGTELWKLSPPVGDTNFDGLVDLVDLNNVRNHFGEPGSVLGDANGDGIVDLEDLNAVRNNFGAAPVASASQRSLNSGHVASGHVAPPANLPVSRAAGRDQAYDLLFLAGETTADNTTISKLAAKKLRTIDHVLATR